MKKKVIVPVLLIISYVMSFLSSYLAAKYVVSEYDWYDSIGEYLASSANLLMLIIEAFIIAAIIYSIYSQKRILSKVLLIIAFFIYGGVYTLRVIANARDALWWMPEDLYYFLIFLSDLVTVIVAVLIIIDSLVNCRIIKVLRIAIPIAGCFELFLNVYDIINYVSDLRVWYYISIVASLLLWFGLSVWVWFHRKPVLSVDEAKIENLLRNARLEYEQQLITEKGYLEKKKEILNKIK